MISLWPLSLLIPLPPSLVPSLPFIPPPPALRRCRGKPQPDIFLEAAKKLGVDPSKCRAFEDGESGLLSAYRAGMQVVDVTYSEGYPLPAGLKAAKEKQLASRDWHTSS